VGLRKAPPDPDRAELISPATEMFNRDMANKVPALRFDISGYGASIFSDWRWVLGPQDQQGITNVLLNVLTGRTAREVVELTSVMAPFAVTVVRTVELKRLSTGVILRHKRTW
jgi:hypothetical protein